MLDKLSPKPLHIQLEDILRQRIENEDWPVNSIIPSENELSKMYGISRMTVRSVLNRIVTAGILYRVPGKGTYVSGGKIEGRPLSYMGIREQLERMGYETSTTLLGSGVIPAPARIAKILGIHIGARVYEINRLRFVKDVPLSIHTSYIAEDECPGLEKQNLQEKQLCKILEQDYKRVIFRQIETLESVTASSEEAEILGVSRLFPLLSLENVVYTSGNFPLEYSKVVFRGDKIKLRLEYE